MNFDSIKSVTGAWWLILTAAATPAGWPHAAFAMNLTPEEQLETFGFIPSEERPLDSLARGVPGFAVTGVSLGSEAVPVRHLALIVRPVEGAELGSRLELGMHRLRQRQVFHEVPRDHIVVGLEAAAGGRALQHLSLVAAKLPEGVTLGPRVRVGDPRMQPFQTQSLGPVAYREVPAGYYLTGLGVATLSGLAGGEGITHIGLHLQRLAVPLDRLAEETAGTRSIYVSSSRGNDNGEGTAESPVATLHRARELAEQAGEAEAIRILLRGGDTFTPTRTMRNEVMDTRNETRSQYAFLWDIDKPLLFSTYGSTEMAVIGPGGYLSDPDAPSRAVGVSAPASRGIIIENIAFRTWQGEVLYVYAYQPREGEGLLFRNNLVMEQGTYFFPGETVSIDGTRPLPLEDARQPGVYPNIDDKADLRPRDWHPFFVGGTVQVRGSANVIFRNNVFRDLHCHFYNSNDPLLIENMHAFYIGRSTGVVLEQNTVQNASGNPLKFSYGQTRGAVVRNNLFLHNSPSINLGVVQTGWVRLSGGRGGDDDWPSDLLIEGNYFLHPYCWENREDCQLALADRISVSRPGVRPTGVTWKGNVFRHGWK